MVQVFQYLEAPEPRSHRQTVGQYELVALSDGALNYPTRMIFGNVPDEAAAQLGLPSAQVTVPYTILLVEVAGKPQIIISGTNRVRGYDLETGTVVWECSGLSANIAASPVAGEDIAKPAARV
jgi:hypothetical protein